MKTKFILFSAVCMALSACNDEPEMRLDTVPDVEIQPQVTETRTPEEAVAIATNAYQQFFGKSASKKAKVNSKSARCNIARSPKRSAAGNGVATGDTAMYVVNFGESNGFAFIAANKNKNAVLAVTESGNFDDPDNIDNLGLKIAYEGAIAYASRIEKPEPVYPPQPFNPQRMEMVHDTISWSIAPRVNVLFYTPENKDNNVHYSCAQVACAMAMSYLKNPTSITLTYDNNTNLPLDWETINNV